MAETTETVTEDAPAPLVDRAAFDAKLTEMKEARGLGKSGLADSLESLGVDVKVTPKEEAPAAPEPESSTPEPDSEPAASPAPESAEDGAGAIVDALSGVDPAAKRQAKMDQRAELQSRAEAAGVPADLAKALATYGKVASVESWLETQGKNGDNPPAGQGDAPAAPVAAKAAPEQASAPEVRSALEDSGLDEETVSVVATAFEAVEARARRAEELAAQSVQVTQDTVRRDTDAQVRGVASELKAQWPDLVSGDRVNQQVGEVAAALMQTPVFEGNLKGAMEAACRATFGDAGKASPGQTNRPAQPELGTPTGDSPLPGKKIEGLDEMRLLTAEAAKYRNDPSARKKALDALKARITRHNRRVK